MKAIARAERKPMGEARRELELEVVEGFGEVVKGARERLGLTQEELGRRIGEKASVVRRIESEEMVPDITLAKKLEHTLKVKLLTRPKEYKVAIARTREAKPTTFTDVVVFEEGKSSR
jgi:putative transcription factor